MYRILNKILNIHTCKRALYKGLCPNLSTNLDKNE